MTPADAPPDLLSALERLRVEVDALHLPLQVTGVAQARAGRTSLTDQLDDYLLPRAREVDAPLLAVVGGSTGAGKSTLVNSLLRREVTRAGVLRPTTRSPVLVHHPDDVEAFAGSRVLPSLARLTTDEDNPRGDDGTHRDGAQPRGDGVSAVRLVRSDALPAGLALLDAPDIDSVVTANRELAGQLLAAADLWLFVTTAARYADAVPWALLRTAVERGTSVAIVLDRVPPEAMDEVRTDLATMLRDNGLASSPLFTLAETTVSDGLLPVDVVAPLLHWLTSLAGDARARGLVVRRTLGGALDSLSRRVPELADAADSQHAAVLALQTDLDTSFDAASRAVEEGLTDGSLLRGEVLARWQEFVGTGEFFRNLESGIGRLRDRLTAALRNRPAPVEPLGEALQTGVEILVRAQAEEALEQSVLRWRGTPAGNELLATTPRVHHLSEDFDDRLQRTVRDWQRAVFDLVKTEGQGRRTTARVLSLGVNGVGVVLMLVAFSATGGALGGAEVGVAGGAAVLAQRLLEAIFGDQAVRTLAAKARGDLLLRVEVLLRAERDRLEGHLSGLGLDPDAGRRLRAAGDAVQAAR